MYVNGYEIPDHNYGTGAGREYHVCNAAGEVLSKCSGKMPAIADANARPPGDAAEPVPEPKPPPLKVVTPPTKKAVGPTTAKKGT